MRTEHFFNRVVWMMLGIAILGGCQDKTPIQVGFVAELTGQRGQLGVDARDGAQLAVERINETNGIHGRRIELLIHDDKGDPDIARQVVTELIDQKVVAIVGPTTSGQVAAIFELINKANMVVISPGASSTQFSGQADYFFRVVPTTDLMGALFARYISVNRNIQRLHCIYDLRNQTYADPLWQAVQQEFEALGGAVGDTFTLTSGETDLQALMMQVKAVNPEAILFIASGIDVALMAQYVQQQDIEAQLFSSPWAQSPELLEKGGQAVEGLELIAGYTPDIPYPPSQEFARRFEARYQRQPGLLASNGYESMVTLIAALERTKGNARGLPEALATIHDVEGAYSAITLDHYGDVKRPVYIARVENGQFTIIRAVSPAE